MQVSVRTVLFIVLGWMSVQSSTAVGQEMPEPKEGDFSITSSVSLGLSGFSTSTQFKLVDELGFEYDVMSLIRDPLVREMTGIDEEQFRDIQADWKTATEPMLSKVLNTVLLDQSKEELKLLFEQAQSDILEQLEPDQARQLDLARHQLGIERFGLTEYLGSKRMSEQLGLSAEQIESLVDAKTDFQSKYQELIRDELVESNTALLQHLEADQRQLLKEQLGSKGSQAFLSTKMFTDSQPSKQRIEPPQTAIAGMTRSKANRNHCGIDAEQYEALKMVKRKMRTMSQDAIASELPTILDTDQLERLEKLAIEDQVSRLGTVNALCYGILSSPLEIAPDQADELFEAGQQIHREFSQNATTAAATAIQQSLSSLSEEQREQVVELIGTADPLKSTR